MTLTELQALKRGDVVEWIEDNAIGLVIRNSGKHVRVMWEKPLNIGGPYTTAGDAARMRRFP